VLELEPYLRREVAELACLLDREVGPEVAVLAVLVDQLEHLWLRALRRALLPPVLQQEPLLAQVCLGLAPQPWLQEPGPESELVLELVLVLVLVPLVHEPACWAERELRGRGFQALS
jgi:hypothetical protein